MSLGSILLIATLVIFVVALFLLLQSAGGNKFSQVTAQQLYYLTSLFLFFSLIVLLIAFLNNDFKFLYVYQNSSLDLPVLYRISAIWAGKEGSFLLWLFILNIFGIFIIRQKDGHENILMTVVVITQIFILLLLVFESPFRYIWEAFPKEFTPGAALPPDFDGAGMNPLLIDPWMVSHPPLLFLGYASAVIPFGYAIAGLLKNDYTSWLKNAYKWVLFSTITLGLGIFLGGYWAYKVLGWGGYWGWDPVENSSLIPWLVGIALMHGLLVQRRRGSLVRTNLFLAMFYHVLVFYSTFLTRSGVLSNFSVHSFGGDGISGYLIYFILFFIIVGLFLFFKKFRSIESPALDTKALHWENLTAYGMVTLFIYGMIILIGTSMPIITGFFSEHPSAVTTNYYNNISMFLGVLLVIIMMAATMSIVKQRINPVISGTLGVVALVLAVVFNISLEEPIVPILFTALGLFVAFQYSYELILTKSKALLPSRLAHIGLGIMVLGIIASGYHSTTDQKLLTQGKEETVGGLALTFDGFNPGKYSSVAFTAKQEGMKESFSVDYYMSSRTNSLYREPHIIPGFLGDLYVTPQDYQSGGVSASHILLTRDKPATLGELKLTFKAFRTDGMMGQEPAIYADIIVRGRKVSPGIKIEREHRHDVKAFVPGTKRAIVLKDFDLAKKIVQVYVEPGKDTAIPPDTILVDVSKKPMIWLVWLGTILISLGGILALVKKKKA